MEERYLICEDSLEGIFTGIYEAYALRGDHRYIHIQIGEGEPRLFAVYIKVQPDDAKACKVARTVNQRLGEETYFDMCKALATDAEEKGEAVYKTIVCGFRMKNGRQVMGNLADPNVHKVFELSRNAGNEIHRLKEFIRFQELENGVLFSRIGPKCNIVSYLAPHFADRLPLINFIIYDEKRNICVIHPASGEWFLTENMALDEEMIGRYSDKEEEYQELFTFFCHKIAIKERKNLKLQRNMLPLRFQEYMVEFSK